MFNGLKHVSNYSVVLGPFFLSTEYYNWEIVVVGVFCVLPCNALPLEENIFFLEMQIDRLLLNAFYNYTF